MAKKTGRPKGAHLAVLCNDCDTVKEHPGWLRCDACTKKHTKAMTAERNALRYSADPSTARQAAIRWAKKNKDRVRQHNGKCLGIAYPLPTRPPPARCEVCNKEDVRKDGITRSLGLDHCHTTGKFRGWLCFKCNSALGKLGDNAAGLRRALAYLERAETDTKEIG